MNRHLVPDTFGCWRCSRKANSSQTPSIFSAIPDVTQGIFIDAQGYLWTLPTHLKYPIDFFFDRVVVYARFRQFAHQVINGGYYVRHFLLRYVSVAVDVVEGESPT